MGLGGSFQRFRLQADRVGIAWHTNLNTRLTTFVPDHLPLKLLLVSERACRCTALLMVNIHAHVCARGALTSTCFDIDMQHGPKRGETVPAA
jgi:hypothetical protein